MLRFKELRQVLSQEEEASTEVEEHISEEHGQLAILSVRKEKLERRKVELEMQDENQNDDEIYQINEEVDSIEFEMKAVQDNVESMEEK